MNLVWHIIIFAICIFLCLAASGILAAVSFAIAAHRFSAFGNTPKKDLKSSRSTGELTETGKFLIKNAWRIAPLISLGRRVLFAAATGFAFLILESIAIASGKNFSLWFDAMLFAASAFFILALNYVFFDLPAARRGKENPKRVLNAIPAWIKVVYYPAFVGEWILRFFGRKIFGDKIFGESACFNYLEVDISLRAREADTDTISQYTGKIVANALKLQELDVSDVMLPRSKVVYFDTEENVEENLAKVRATKHNRYPLCKGNLDNCFGIIHLKDIFLADTSSKDFDFMQIRRDTMRLRETDKLEVALAKLLKYRLQMALVEDEFGGVIGVFTLDSALGELVGRIRDEFDSPNEHTIRSIGNGSYKVSGLAPLHKIEDFLDIDFETDEVSTLGGLITRSLGKFPEKDEKLYFKNQKLRVIVDEVGERMIKECTIKIEEPKE